VYGSTEAEPIAHIDLTGITDDDFARMQRGAGLLAGHPVAAITLRIVRDAAVLTDLIEPLPPGEIGEILVTGPHVLRGYLNGAGDHETKVRLGSTIWHRTGDAGRLGSDGRLWLLGRCAAKVEDARGSLYPFSVECVAQEHPGVARAAFVQHRGQRCLVVEANEQFAEHEQWTLEAKLSWAGLDRVIKVATLPLDERHNAKIDYRALHRLLQKLDSQSNR